MVLNGLSRHAHYVAASGHAGGRAMAHCGIPENVAAGSREGMAERALLNRSPLESGDQVEQGVDDKLGVAKDGQVVTG